MNRVSRRFLPVYSDPVRAKYRRGVLNLAMPVVCESIRTANQEGAVIVTKGKLSDGLTQAEESSVRLSLQ